MGHIALYRQFRPMNFDEIVEQTHAVAPLRQSVITGRIGHAYLFSGQRGTGKTSIARVFSRAINCENPVNGNPCNTCPTCKGILDGTLMDVIEIDAASNTSVDNIRKISEEVNFAPSRAPHKVYIIDEVHMISSGAFNALLKTLEEPPAHAVFLFATTEPHRIPVTVLSRCQRYNFKRISQDSIASRLRYICNEEHINADDDALRIISSLSDGAMRDAISILDQAASAADGKLISSETIENITGTVDNTFLARMSKVLIDGKFDELVPMCNEIAESGLDIVRFALDLAEYFRKLLIIRTVPNPTGLIPASASVLKEMYSIASTVAPETLVAFISALSSMIADLKWSPSVRTSFEIGLIRLCGRKVKADIVPLTIPEFDKLQGIAAKEIIAVALGEAKPTEEKKAETKVPEAIQPAAEPVKAEVKEPEVSEVKAPEVKETPVVSEPDVKAEPVAAEPAPVAPAEPATLVAPVPPVEPAAPVVPDIPAVAPVPAAPSEEENPEDKPLENQMDLFSMAMGMSEPATPEQSTSVPEITMPAPEVAPVTPVVDETPVAPKPASGGNKIFADLSSSFLDDIVMPYDAASSKPSSNVASVAAVAPELPTYEEPTSEPEAPALHAWENQRTSLANMLETTPIATVQPKKEPEKAFEYKALDTDSVWKAVITRIEPEDHVLFSMLDEAEFRVMNDGGYIVFEDKDKGYIEEIKKEPSFKQVSSGIKNALKEIQHVYMCSETQYQNALKRNGAPVKQTISKAEELINKSKQLGINTEIHFGDN